MSYPASPSQADGQAEIRGLFRRSLRRSMPVQTCLLPPGAQREMEALA